MGTRLRSSKQVLSREHKIGKTGLDVQEAARQEEEMERLSKTANGGPTEVCEEERGYGTISRERLILFCESHASEGSAHVG